MVEDFVRRVNKLITDKLRAKHFLKYLPKTVFWRREVVTNGPSKNAGLS